VHPVDALEPIGIDRGEVCGCAPVGDHRALSVGIDEDDDRTRASFPLHPHVDSGSGHLGDEDAADGVVADTADEAHGMPRCSRHGHVRCAAAARDPHLGRVVGAAFQRRAPEDDQVGDHVADDREHQARPVSARAIRAPSSTLPR
jgi:hypothetical protein